MFKRFRKNNLGAVATEYAFLIAFIALLAAIGMTILGNNLSTFYNDIGSALEDKACEVPVPAADPADGKAKDCKDK
jgi:Flp pilus assembly pilin Flp